MTVLAPPNRSQLIAGRFKTQKSMGEGTFGIVYLATDAIDHTYVALKKFRSRKPQDGIDYNTIQEIRQLSELSHPNILRFIGVYSWEGSLYIATEYLPVSLAALINPTDKSSVLSAADRKCIMRMILEGLRYLHENWILHRDLKPGNLLLSAGGILKLIDFGLSTDYPPDFGEMISQVVTQWYRAPELCFGARYYGPAVDMWSVGCIFAEMLLGEPFLPGANDIEQLQLIADKFGPVVWPGCDRLPGFIKFVPSKPVRPLGEIFRAENPDVVDLIARMFTLDPAERISAADALLHPYFTQCLPAATLPSDLPIQKELRVSPAGTAMALAPMTGVGGITNQTRRYAPGTTLIRAQSTARIDARQK
jgi:serine/threonine protein kinase